MPEIKTCLELNDPVTTIWRSGTPDDPYKDRMDSLPIINNQMTLLEIPSHGHKVMIEGFTEIDQERFTNRSTLAPDEFLVNYSNGIVQFHPAHEGTTLLCKYKGKGLILYPASRIYAMVSRSPDVVQTLQDIIDEMLRRLQETNTAIADLKQVIVNAETATHAANLASDNANQAADDAKLATEKALHAYNTTTLVFKPPVADMKELLDTYPYPQVGWTVQTYKDGMRYRFDGKSWIPIDMFGQNIQAVSEHADGLMSIAEHVKLKSIPLDVKDRVIVFCLPSYLFQGVQSVIAKFPFQGEIVSVEAICGVPGDSDTEIQIEKTADLVHWSSILSHNLHFKPHQFVDDRTSAVSSSSVNAGDMFRLNVVKQGGNIQNVTVEMVVRI
ncbi:hypothetical protein [Paenibacillus apiarius]|uniref:hypothetical protein n=1 Tax=Paenibacillus apiarius TaxID=46240 RepID=UPI00197DAB79|nr:hypothetical protein [Paenibacillus apiarius]MBN3522252.1 hypothetical protein [Paenibacillus apiarius]